MARINIITGEKHSGKTTFLLNIIQELRENGDKISGLISRGTFVDNKRHSFYVQDIVTKEEQLLMSSEVVGESEKMGRFYIQQFAFDWGTIVLEKALNSNCDSIVLDEIGRFELDDKGWANILPSLIQSDKELYFVVRKEWVSEIIEKYKIANYVITQI